MILIGQCVKSGVLMPVSGEVGVVRHESFGATLHPPTTKSKLIHGAPSVSYAASDYILRLVAGIPHQL